MLKKILLSIAAFLAVYGAADAQAPRNLKRDVIDARIANSAPASPVAIAAGVFTLNQASHILAAETGTADTVTSFVITAMQAGDTVKIAPDVGDTITIDAAISDTGAAFDIAGDQFAFVHIQPSGAYVVSLGGGNTGIIKSYANIAALEALSFSRYADGDAVVISDSVRGGVFVYDTSSIATLVAADAQKGVAIPNPLTPDGSAGGFVRQAYLENPKRVIVDWFGAISTGQQADAATNTTAFQAALDLARTDLGHGVGVDVVATGYYIIGSTIDIGSNTRLIGGGRLETSSAFTQNTALLETVTLSGGAGVYAQSDIYIDITLDGAGRSITDTARIALAKLWSVDGLTFGPHFKAQDHDYILVSLGGVKNVVFEPGATFTDWGHPTVNGTYPEGGSAIWISEQPSDGTDSERVTIDGATFRDADWCAIYALGKDITITNSTFDSLQECAIYAQNNATAGIDSENIKIIGNTFSNITLKYVQSAAVEASAFGLIVSGNTFQEIDGAGVDLTTNGESQIVMQNNFYRTALNTPAYNGDSGGQITVRIAPGDAEGDIPQKTIISNNVLGRDEGTPGAKYGIALLYTAAGATAFDDLIVTRNQLANSYTGVGSAPMRVDGSIIGTGSFVCENPGDTTIRNCNYVDNLYVRQDGAAAKIGVDVDDAQVGSFDWLKDGCVRWRAAIAAGEDWELRRFNSSCAFVLSAMAIDDATGYVTINEGLVLAKPAALTINNMQVRGSDTDPNGGTANDGAITASATTFTSASASFTANDVGKNIEIAGAGVGGATLYTYISGYTNSTTVTVALAASTTVSGSATYIYGSKASTGAILFRSTSTPEDMIYYKGSGTNSATGWLPLLADTISYTPTVTFATSTDGGFTYTSSGLCRRIGPNVWLMSGTVTITSKGGDTSTGSLRVTLCSGYVTTTQVQIVPVNDLVGTWDVAPSGSLHGVIPASADYMVLKTNHNGASSSAVGGANIGNDNGFSYTAILIGG